MVIIIASILYLIIGRVIINIIDWIGYHVHHGLVISHIKFAEGYRIILSLIFPLVVLWWIVANLGYWIAKKIYS